MTLVSDPFRVTLLRQTKAERAQAEADTPKGRGRGRRAT